MATRKEQAVFKCCGQFINCGACRVIVQYVLMAVALFFYVSYPFVTLSYHGSRMRLVSDNVTIEESHCVPLGWNGPDDGECVVGDILEKYLNARRRTNLTVQDVAKEIFNVRIFTIVL